MRYLRLTAGWLLAVLVLLWRLTCRFRVLDDPRPRLRAAGKPYAYALLHAHQVAAVFVNDERHMAAMVSRSADADLLVPALRLRRVRAVRGSSRNRRGDKGGRTALAALTGMAATTPVLLAADGPQGPRGRVRKGIVELALRADAVILPTAAVCSRRWVLSRTWDRLQLPQPFSTITLAFGPPLALDGASHTDMPRFQEALASALATLEAQLDPDAANRPPAPPRKD